MFDDLTGGFAYLTRFVGRSTKGFGSFLESTAQLTTDLDSATVGTSKLALGLGSLTTIIAGGTALVEIFSGAFNSLTSALTSVGSLLVTVLTPGWETMTTMQSGILSIQTALKGMSTTEGQAVTTAQAHAGALGLVNRAMMDAQKSAFSFNEIMEAMSGTLPMFLGKGMNAEQAYNITKGVAATAKLHNLAPHQVVQESRDIAQGSITPGHSQVANALGITNDDIKKYEGDTEGLVNFLQGKFKESIDALEEYSNTPKGAIEQFQETLGIAGAKILDEFGDPIVAVFKTLTDMMGTFNETTGEFELSPALESFGSVLEEIALYTASCIDVLINMAEVVTDTNDPVEAFGDIVIWLIDAFTTLTGTLMGVITILDGIGSAVRVVSSIIVNAMGVICHSVTAAAQSFVALYDAMAGDKSGAKALLGAAKEQFGLASKDATALTDFKGMWKGTQGDSTYGRLFGDGGDNTKYLGKSGNLYALVSDALAKAKSREKKPSANPAGYKGTYVDRDEDKKAKKAKKDADKANKQAIKEDQQKLKEHREAIKNILDDTLDKLKDLLEENEISYKEGFASIKEYYTNKADLEKQEAEARLKAAKEELEAINNSRFNNDYEKLSAQHKVEREIEKYSKELGKAQQAQVEVGKSVGQYTQAMGNMQTSMMNNMLDFANIIQSISFGQKAGTSGGTITSTGDKLMDLAVAVTKEVYDQSGKKLNPGYVWGLLADETGRGTSNVFKTDNNPGGITWSEEWGRQGFKKGLARPSSEGGYYVHFDDLAQAAKQQAQVLTLSRYSGLDTANSAQSFLDTLKSGGYMATDDPESLRNYVSLMDEGAKKFSDMGISVESILNGATASINGLSKAVNDVGGSVSNVLNQTFSQLVNKEMPDLANGCVEAVVRLGAGFSEVLDKELKNNVASITTLEADLKAAGVKTDKNTSSLNPGDILVVNGGSHVVMVQDSQHTVGNSSHNNPNTNSGSGIMQQDLSYWQSRTDRVIRTGSMGLKNGMSSGNMNLLSADKTKLGNEAFEAMKKQLEEYRALVDEINADIFGTLPDVESQLQSLYNDKDKLERSSDPIDKKRLEAVLHRIQQKTTQIMSEFFIDMLDFNLGRLETTAKYRSTEIAYGKNNLYDTSFEEMLSKYNGYFNNTLDINPINKQVKKLTGIKSVYANPVEYYKSYMEVNDEEWKQKNSKDSKPIWDKYTGKLKVYEELKKNLNDQVLKTVDSVDVKSYTVESRKKLEKLAKTTKNTELKTAVEKFYKYNDEFYKYISDPKNSPVITAITKLEKAHNDSKKFIKDNNVDFSSIAEVANAYKKWKKVNDELWEMQNVEGKKGTAKQIEAKTEEFEKLLKEYNDKKDTTDRSVKELDMELSKLQTQLNLAKQTPANQIQALTKQFAEYTRLGNTKAAENVRKKILEAREKLFSMVESWINEISNRFDNIQNYFDAVPMTNLQRERGNAELKYYKNRELANKYRSALNTFKGNYQDNADNIYNNRSREKYLEARNKGLSSTSSEYINNTKEIQRLIAEREILIEEQQSTLGKLNDIQQKMLIAEELARVPSLLNDIRDTSKQALEDGLVTFLTDGVNEAESLGKALRNLALDFLKTMQKMFAQRLTTSLIEAWFPAKTHEGKKTDTDDMARGISNVVTRDITPKAKSSDNVINAKTVDFSNLKTLNTDNVINKDKLTYNMTQEGEVDTSRGALLSTFKGYGKDQWTNKDFDWLNKEKKDNEYSFDIQGFKHGAYESKFINKEQLEKKLDGSIVSKGSTISTDIDAKGTEQQQLVTNTGRAVELLTSIDSKVGTNGNGKDANSSISNFSSSVDSATNANRVLAVESTNLATKKTTEAYASSMLATETNKGVIIKATDNGAQKQHTTDVRNDSTALQKHSNTANTSSSGTVAVGAPSSGGSSLSYVPSLGGSSLSYASNAGGYIPIGMQTKGIGASLGNSITKILQPITNIVSKITNQIASFLNSGVFSSLLNSVTSITGSAGAQLGGSVYAIGRVINGDSKERLLAMIYLELQLIYLQMAQLVNKVMMPMSRGFATGGKITGPGTETSDSIPSMLSNNEYVVKASAVRKYGTNFLDSVNSGRFSRVPVNVAHFANGGAVNDTASKAVGEGINNFGQTLSNNISNKATFNVALVRDEREGMKQLLKSTEGQRILLDFQRQYASVTRRF